MARFKCFTYLLTYIHYCGPERKEITQSARRDWLTDRWRGIAACRAGTTASWWTATTTHQRPSDSPSRRRRRRSAFCSQQSSTHSHTHTHTHTHTGKVRQSGDGTRIRHAGYDSVARDSEKSRSFSRHPHVKWPMPRPNADIKCSGLTPRIFRIVYRYFWAYPFLLFSSSFSTFLLLVPCGRISWLMLAYEPML